MDMRDLYVSNLEKSHNFYPFYPAYIEAGSIDLFVKLFHIACTNGEVADKN